MGRLVTLLSDFGSRSPYPAAMKAIIAARAHVRFLDITHDVARHDVREGAFLLASVAPWCPAGTVHLAVVDPGVGTGRRALIVLAGGQAFVGPDNGLLMPAARRVGEPRVVALHAAAGLPFVSPTFHGRDLFAPATARLALGAPPDRLGRRIEDPIDLAFGTGAWVEGVLQGEVLYVDAFGNLITTIPADLAPPSARFTLATAQRSLGTVIRRTTYGEGEPAELMLVAGGEGLLEIAVREGSAQAATSLTRGAPVSLRPSVAR